MPCLPGTYRDLSTEHWCSVCREGTYTTGFGSASCTVCPAGHVCRRRYLGPSACELGTYSPAGSTVCSECPEDTFCPDPSIPPIRAQTRDDSFLDRVELRRLADICASLYAKQLPEQSRTLRLSVNNVSKAVGVVLLDDSGRDGDTIIAAFRGTMLFEFESALYNSFINLATHKVEYVLCAGCEVHRGFLFTYHSIARYMFQHVADLRAQHPNARRLVVTGHSMGGSMATLFASELKARFGIESDLITFGSPRVGNAAYAQFVNARLAGRRNWRFTYGKDMVTSLPNKRHEYAHVGREVHVEPRPGGGLYFVLPLGLDAPYRNRRSIEDHRGYWDLPE